MRTIHLLLAVVMIVALASFTFARGAPTKKAFTDQAIVSVHAPPVVASVPPMTVGYDAIQNITESANPRLASVSRYMVDISTTLGLSTTVAKRGYSNRTNHVTKDQRARSQPALVLLA